MGAPIKRITQVQTYGILPAVVTIGELLLHVRVRYGFDSARFSLKLMLAPLEAVSLDDDKTMWDMDSLMKAHATSPAVLNKPPYLQLYVDMYNNFN